MLAGQQMSFANNARRKKKPETIDLIFLCYKCQFFFSRIIHNMFPRVRETISKNAAFVTNEREKKKTYLGNEM